MTTLQKDILAILSDDARLNARQIAAMLSTDEKTVQGESADLEKTGVIVKYTTIVNAEKADDVPVEALIEVKVTPKSKEGFDGIAKQIAAFDEVQSVYLMSGAYDLAVFISDKTLQQLARFVSERISTFDGVLSTATHFILKKYKIEGAVTEKADEDRRILVQA